MGAEGQLMCLYVCYLSPIVWPWGENNRRIREPFKTPNTNCPSSQQWVYYHSFTHRRCYMCVSGCWFVLLYMQTLIISQHQLKEAEAEVSKLQNHLKELNREYRARLTRYIQDVTVRVPARRHMVNTYAHTFYSVWCVIVSFSKGSFNVLQECVTAAGDGDLGQKLKGFVESMLEEVKTSYRSREEQLTKAVRTYRKRIQGLSNTYQQLLIAYRCLNIL